MKNIYRAIKNESIRDGILRTWGNLSQAVERNLELYPFLTDYAEDVRQAKIEVASNYDRWIARATESLGCNVYFAEDAEEARKIVGEIVGSGKIVVKAKSMVSEEIHLREYLSRNNEVWETDLGELIIQLANDKPMHMVVPALHYSERQAAEILRKVGVKGQSAEELAEGVRNFMRQKFLAAHVGISGCNAFSAETGRIFLIENEGNIRLSINLPKTYIAIVSIDKILPSDEHCLKSIMVQSAFFGTFPPTYINVKKQVEGQDMHVIFLDNGRIEAASFLREQLNCVRCGRCQLECPVFHIMGNLWGAVYGGPMGMGWTAITDKINGECFLSCLCGRCKEVCPMRIDMPKIIRELRKRATAVR
jgi:L-lactate dehydrogenase complex protein LldG